MKNKLFAHIVLVNLTIILLISPIAAIEGAPSQWSSAITVKSYHWKASKSELRNLWDSEEQYRDTYLIGGKNIRGGGTSVSLKSDPPDDFDFFNGSRLDLYVIIEGDMAIDELPQYSTDYHLLLLPMKINNDSFFEVLFEEKDLLENLTHSIYVSSLITDTIARAYLKYNNVLDIQYEWDTTTGLLMRKEVTSPSGLQLIVVPGKGNLMPGWNFPIALIAVLIVVLWQIKKRNDK